MVLSLLSIKERNFLKPTVWILGVFITLAPFVIFDLRHPPGLFLTRILYASPVETTFSSLEIFNKAWVWFQYMLKYYTQSNLLSFMLGVSISLLLIIDIKTREKAILFAIPWVTQVIGLIFIYNPGPIYYYYLLPSTIFFLTWLIIPRQSYSKIITSIILAILLLGGLFSIIPKLTQTNWQTDIKSIREINYFISKMITANDMKNVNIAVLESPDNNTYGRRYRDLLLLQNINLRSKDEYDLTDHLFVVSMGDEQALRKSPAYEMHNFMSGLLVNFLQVNNSEWKVYHFTRNINPKL
ncbi:MAG: hypothetical protein M1365_03400 [Actinobacteria bacterium]|nr:hypothetical protein [Actinomycetota bacterium]